jgi:hypothetical protein
VLLNWIFEVPVVCRSTERLSRASRHIPILGFRQDAWVPPCATMNANRPNSSKYFGRCVLNLSVWKRMSREDLQLSEQHNERGAESLAVTLQLHDSFVLDSPCADAVLSRLRHGVLAGRQCLGHQLRFVPSGY